MRQKRRRHQEEHENHERWLVSYADFITLLFAFFTVLYATSERNLEKTKEFQQSVQQFLVKAGAFGGSGDQVNQGEKYNSPIEPPIQTFKQSPTEASDLQAKIVAILESSVTQEQLDKLIIDISSDDYGARLVLAGDEVFEGNGDTLKRQSVPLLNLIGEMLLNLKEKVIVEGHSQQGTPERSREMASKRSNKLVNFFLRNDQDHAGKFIAMSLGDQRPLAEIGSAESPRLNERIEIRILSDDTPF